MKQFMDGDFLLGSKTARELYHGYAAQLPIIDYHCHINPEEIARDRRYETITELWLGGDHYKWRAMRANGVPEDYITGKAHALEKFRLWAETVPKLMGNPLYHWTHLELQRYFGVDEPLCAENAPEIFEHCNRLLLQPTFSVRGIIHRSNVELLCSTDDPLDTLQAHAAIEKDESFQTQVLPTFRPDKAVHIENEMFPAYIKELECACGFPIADIHGLFSALRMRMDHFEALGCRLSDHALERCVYRASTVHEQNASLVARIAGHSLLPEQIEAFQTAMLSLLAAEYCERDWVMQLHFGCIRNNSDKMFSRLGPDTGYDSILDAQHAQKLSQFLSVLETNHKLPKMIFYSLNPADNDIITTVMGCFQTNSGGAGRMQMGSAWWFNDHKQGMEKQLCDLANNGILGNFVGMLTDSRSFLSYTRHEYFRRILCNLIGTWVENGEYPNNREYLEKIVSDISYANAKQHFGFAQKQSGSTMCTNKQRAASQYAAY